MSTKDVVTEMQILLQYYDHPDCNHTSAEHDVIYMSATDKPISAEDLAKLKELAWFQTDVEEDDDGHADYDADEGWQTFV